MCQCIERRIVIVDAASAAASGDFSKIAPAAAFVGTTMVQDIKAVGASALAMARQRLGARR